MSVTPEALFEAASTISQGDREEDWRNAASRAYYAAFHKCRALADESGWANAKGSAHQALIDALLVDPNPTVRSLGYMLNDCRHRRRSADYDIADDFQQEWSEMVLHQCKRIIARVEGLAAQAQQPV